MTRPLSARFERIDDYDPNAPLPKAGSCWIWEIGSAYGRTLCQVVEVKWNGEQWWVYLRKLRTDIPIGARAEDLGPEPSEAYPNEISRFWEAATPVGGRAEDLAEWRPEDTR